jgi:SAM-dependent methyltransferase
MNTGENDKLPIAPLPTEPFVYDYPGAHDAVTYELENRIADPDARIEAQMDRLLDMTGRVVADVGAGGGYHAVRYAQRAAHVFAVEPAPRMLIQLHRRIAAEPEWVGSRISVLAAGAAAIPLPDESVDLFHSRLAYFFGPASARVRSCEPGIAEALRIVRPGGEIVIIDNDLREGDFAAFLREFGYAAADPALADRLDEFWAAHGFTGTTVMSEWRAPSRKALGRVLAMEFGERDAASILTRIDGARFRYGYRLYHRQR